MPYQSLDSPTDAVLTLKVVGPTAFEVIDGFRYVDQYDGNATYEVPNGTPTDLASVPFFLQWLVRSYGKHTMAAIVHDQYWDEDKTMAELRKSNTVFRHGMWESDVPLVRRWFIWAAVTLGMLVKPWHGKLRAGIWVVGLVTAATALFFSGDDRVSWNVLVGVAAVAVTAGIITGAARTVDSSAIARISKLVGIAALVLVAIVGLICVVGRVDWVADNRPLAAVLAIAVGIAAWGGLVLAGAIATVEVAVVILPAIAIAVGLAIYGVLELAATGALKVGRVVKRRTGRPVVGTLNPVVSDKLTAAEPAPEARLTASQA